MTATKKKRNLFKDKSHWISTWSRFKAGDRFAFEEIYSEYIDSLFIYGSKISGDKELVKDSIQDLFIDIYRYKIDLKKPESFEFYLYKALKRIILKKLKKNKQFVQIENTNLWIFNIEDKYFHDELEESKLRALQKSLNELSENCRELLFYKFYSNLTYKEIGLLLGMKPDTAKKQVYRLLIQLRKNFILNPIYILIMCFITH